MAWYIDQHNTANKDDDTVFKPNLKGFAVGNGVTNWEYDTTAAYIDMSYWHSLISEEMHEQFVALDCQWNMPYMFGVSDECMTLFDEFNALTADVNVYDIFGVCWGSGPYPQATHDEPTMIQAGDKKHHRQYVTEADYTPWVKKSRQGTSLNELPPCTFGSALLAYMNDDEVRTAMHIPDYVQAWDLCKSGMVYESGKKASQWIYEDLQGKYKMLHYSGDTDGAVPTVGTQGWIATLGWDKTSEW